VERQIGVAGLARVLTWESRLRNIVLHPSVYRYARCLLLLLPMLLLLRPRLLLRSQCGDFDGVLMWFGG